MNSGRRRTAAPKREGGGSQALHMTFRLSPELRSRLIAAAGERPIGDEIRRRLERSFERSYEPVLWDRRSLAFLDGIVAAMNTLGSDHLLSMVNALAFTRKSSVKTVTPARLDKLGRWHSDPNAFAALQAAIEQLLRIHRPEGEPDEIADDTLASIAVGAAMMGVNQRNPKLVDDLLGTGEEER